MVQSTGGGQALVRQFVQDERFAVSIKRQIHNPTSDRESQQLGLFQSHFNRQFPDGPDVVIRHAFPPNWEKPAKGKWIHIQPWEFGHLPKSWIEPLRDHVDEIWIPSNYLRGVYERSGIPTEKIQVIAWGVDPEVFTPHAPPRILPTKKSFRFLYVGGTIHRKGYDRVLEAYLQEFSAEEDVCLVVKDLGTNTFYRHGNLQDETLRARDNSSLPEIVYFDGSWTPGQLASLYTACNCLVMPYRGEGFGLPILEAMACGVPPIVPRGGASDDFVSDETGYLLESCEVETSHEWPLVCPALELEVEIAELRRLMRSALVRDNETKKKGHRAAEFVQCNFLWDASFELMVQRTLRCTDLPRDGKNSENQPHRPNGLISACIETHNNEFTIAECLASMAPYVDDILVVDAESDDRTVAIAVEYGARVVSRSPQVNPHAIGNLITSDWLFWIQPDKVLEPACGRQIKPLALAQPAASTQVTMRLDATEIGNPLQLTLTKNTPR